MVEWVNVLLRTLMCAFFIFWVIRPMLMNMVRKDLDLTEIEEVANTATQIAFEARQQDDTLSVYNDAMLAMHLLENPNMALPGDASLEQAHAEEQALIEAQEAKRLADEQAAAAALAEAEAQAQAEAQAHAEAEAQAQAEAEAQAQAEAPGAAAEGVDPTALAVVDGAAVDPATGTVALAADADDEDAGESLEEMKKRIQAEQKKAKPKIPTELLTNANSYEDKLVVVQMITDQDQNRVAMAIRNMIRGDAR